MIYTKPLLLLLACIELSACGGTTSSKAVTACQQGLEGTYDDLNDARRMGGQDKIEYAQAVALIAQAKTQVEQGEYQLCIDTLQRARDYIRQSVQAP